MGATPDFPPAYDLVAYSAFDTVRGHALPIVPPEMAPRPATPAQNGAIPVQALSAAMVRVFYSAPRIPEKPAAAALKRCVAAAHARWPTLTAESKVTGKQKSRLLPRFKAHEMVRSLALRSDRKSR